MAGATFTHDLNGNLTGDGARTFGYDAENRLTSVSGSASLSLTYDPLGRLRQTIAGATTDFLYDGDRLIAEYNGATLLRRYAHGPGVDEPIVWYEGATLATKRWLHPNERGSIVAWTNASAVATVYKYGAYGEPAGGDFSGSRFRYTGQIALPEVSLYHYKARVYDPNLGRFLQTDPVGYEDDFNLYAYVYNDPLNKADPTGQWAWIDDAIAISAGAIVGLGAQAVEDLSSGQLSSGRDYAASALGGAVAGETALYTVPTLGPAGVAVAGAAGSIAADVAKSTLNPKENPFSATKTSVNATVGAVAGFVPGLKGSLTALAKQIMTKFQKGLIQNVRASTAGKVVTGLAAENAGGAAVSGAASAAVNEVTPSDRCEPVSSASCK